MLIGEYLRLTVPDKPVYHPVYLRLTTFPSKRRRSYGEARQPHCAAEASKIMSPVEVTILVKPQVFIPYGASSTYVL